MLVIPRREYPFNSVDILILYLFEKCLDQSTNVIFEGLLILFSFKMYIFIGKADL